MLKHWHSDYEYEIQVNKVDKFYESKILTINSSKARDTLNWAPRYDMESICISIAEYEKSNNKFDYAVEHINTFINQIT